MLYLSFFWAHFKILKFSGPGDSFMSPAFQETLQGNELLLNAQGVSRRRPEACSDPQRSDISTPSR